MGFLWYLILSPLRLLKSLVWAGVVVFALIGTFLLGTMVANADTITVNTTSNGNVIGAIGYNAAENGFVGQRFTGIEDGTVTAVDLIFSKTGSPTDDIVALLMADVGGSPSGIALATSTAVDSSTFGPEGNCASNSVTTLTFASGDIDANDFWVVLRRQGARSTTNYANVCGDTTSNHGQLLKRTSGDDVTWVTETNKAAYLLVDYTPGGGGGGGGTVGGLLPGQWLLVILPVAIAFLFFLHISKPAEKFLAGLSPSPFLKKLFGVNWRSRPHWYD